jgi:hypothetical protein
MFFLEHLQEITVLAAIDFLIRILVVPFVLS